MFRRSLCALAAVAGLSVVSSVNAHPPVVVYPSYPAYYHSHHARVQVMYRSCAYEPWRSYGTYWNEREAHHAAHHLRHRGFEVFMRGC